MGLGSSSLELSQAIFQIQNGVPFEQFALKAHRSPLTDIEVWQNEKLGKFSASRINELCTKDRTRKGLGKTAHNYILDVFSDFLGEKQERYISSEMQYGMDNEPFAARLLATQFKDFNYLGKKFYPYPNKELYAGASPDFMVGNDISGEIKVACSAKKQLEYLSLRRAQDLLEYDKKYYYQVQMQIVCTGAKHAYFVAFNPKWANTKKHKLSVHILRIKRDEKVIDDIENSLNLGIEVFNNYKELYGV